MDRESEAAAKGPSSVEWTVARKLFLDFVFEKRSESTYDDYRNILTNTPEFRRLEGRQVVTVTDTEIAKILKDVSARAQPHAEHVQRVLASMWSRLSTPDFRLETGIAPDVIAHVRAPERDSVKIDEIGDGDEEDVGPPPRQEIGRYIAIARLGVFGERLSPALLLLAGTAQRRRPVAGANLHHFHHFQDEVLWKMVPYFRKPSKKKRSSGRHLVPCIGFAAQAVRDLDRLAGDQPWMLPVSRSRNKGKQTKRPHQDPSALNHALLAMPGVGFATHAFRSALATYGPQDLGWMRSDPKLILDHLEGYDAGDVTAQHYNTDPELRKKREMMRAWVTWLEAQEREAVCADPMLLDYDAIAEQVYRGRLKGVLPSPA